VLAVAAPDNMYFRKQINKYVHTYGAEVTGQYRRHFKREAASYLRHPVYFQAEGNH